MTKLMQKHLTRPIRPKINRVDNMYFVDGLIWACPKQPVPNSQNELTRINICKCSINFNFAEKGILSMPFIV